MGPGCDAGAQPGSKIINSKSEILNPGLSLVEGKFKYQNVKMFEKFGLKTSDIVWSSENCSNY
jgi:hypothetical protein